MLFHAALEVPVPVQHRVDLQELRLHKLRLSNRSFRRSRRIDRPANAEYTHLVLALQGIGMTFSVLMRAANRYFPLGSNMR